MPKANKVAIILQSEILSLIVIDSSTNKWSAQKKATENNATAAEKIIERVRASFTQTDYSGKHGDPSRKLM